MLFAIELRIGDDVVQFSQTCRAGVHLCFKCAEFPFQRFAQFGKFLSCFGVSAALGSTISRCIVTILGGLGVLFLTLLGTVTGLPVSKPVTVVVQIPVKLHYLTINNDPETIHRRAQKVAVM